MRILSLPSGAALIAAMAMSAVSFSATTPAVEARTGGAQAATQGATAGRSRESGTTTATGRARASPADVTTKVVPRTRFVWPLSPQPAVLRPFDQPRSQWSRGHRGVDLAAAVGQAVLSAGDGVVAFSGVVAGRGVVTVRHDAGLRTTYQPVDERRATGTLVRRGTQIAVLGPTPGHCVPLACLHWGALSGVSYRDPLSLLGLGHPVLLPLR